MWQYDFNLFFAAGQSVLKGMSPYLIYDFNPPFLLAILFAPIAWIPQTIVYTAYVVTCVALIWKIRKWNTIWVILAFPVFFNLFVGQIDLLLTLITILVGPYALPLLLVKPQLAFVLAPWFLRRINRKQLQITVIASIAFIALSFILRPTWLEEWFQILPTVNQYARRDSNMYWLIPSNYKSIVIIIGCFVALPLGFWLKERRNSWIVLHLFAPLTNIYSASVLIEWIGPLEFILSWLAFLVVGDIHSGAPMFVVALSILVRFYIRNKRDATTNMETNQMNNLNKVSSHD